MPIRVVLADDHPLTLKALNDLFAGEEGFEVVASCTNGHDALKAVCQHKPDILLSDIRMPGKDGIAVLKEIRERATPVHVVLLTGDISEQEALHCIRLGARGLS
jgi:DNA-binding NarL/FixJ family response regulator